MSVSMRRCLTALLAAALCVAGAPNARAAESDTVDDMAAMTANIGRTPFAIQGFGNVDVLANSPNSTLHSGFQTGALDLFITSRLGDHWSALIELVFEPAANEIVADLERFEFMYEHSDAFKLSAGRVHNPFLHWPIVNHHGLFMQTTLNRPAMARWEDEPGLWPMHFVGLMAQGRLHGNVGLSYAVGLGNGRGVKLDEVQVGADANDDKAVVASLGMSPEAIPGLEARASFYADQIPVDPAATVADTTLRERDFGYAAAYVRGGVELRGEWSRLNHRNDLSGHEFVTTGWYALAALRIPIDDSRIKPYGMLEEVDAAKGEKFLGYPEKEKAWAAGVRWDVNRWVALKGEFRSSTVGSGSPESAVRGQLAVNF